MALKDQIRTYRKQIGMSIEELSSKSGVPISTLKKISAGVTRDPQVETLRAIAYALGKTLDDFESPATASDYATVSNIVPLPPMHHVPLVGTIACGTPITAEQNVEGYVSVDGDLNCQFALRCKGDSMSPRVISGDLVYIRQQPDVEDGQIAAVLIGEEATLKHVYHLQDGVQLVSDNPAYRPLIYTGEACAEVRILGLAVAYQRLL